MIVLGVFCIFMMLVIIWLWVAYSKACEYSNDLSGKASRLSGENKRMRKFIFYIRKENSSYIILAKNENDEIDELTKSYQESFS